MTPGLPDWARAYGGPFASARIRSCPEDFDVSELLGFEPGDDGAHLFLLVEKRGHNTVWAAEQLAQAFGIPPRDIGYSGMKDRHAVTRQWFSVPDPRRAWNSTRPFDLPGLRVLRTGRNARKLRRGVHRGNRFVLRLRNCRGDLSGLDNALQRLAADGFPNYFGEQRFGRDAANVDLARQLFRGTSLRRHRRSIALSAARSLIFNACLARRVQHGNWDRLLPGDVANLDGSGSVFEVNEMTDELEERSRKLDVHPTGPLWGAGAPSGTGFAADLERSVANEYADLRDGLDDLARAARRPLRARVTELAWTLRGNDLALEFTLPRGAYATALLRELVR